MINSSSYILLKPLYKSSTIAFYFSIHMENELSSCVYLGMV